MTATTVAAATLQELKLGQIKPHSSNIRADVGDVVELASSIREHGVLEPLIVIPDRGAKTRLPRFLLLAGHRRLAAAALAKVKTVPCIVREDVDDPATQIETMLIENLQRTDLTPMEEAWAYQQLLAFDGYTQKRITERTGRPATTVRGRIALTKLSEQAQARIQARQISLADAVVLAEFSDDPMVADRLEAAVGTSNWPWAVQRARDARARVKAAAKVAAALTKSGLRVVTGDELAQLEQDEVARADKTDTEPDMAWLNVETLHRFDPVEHASCPGHAVDVDAADEWDDPASPPVWALVCTQPALHARSSAPDPASSGPAATGAPAPRDSVSGVLADPAAAAAEAERKAALEAERAAGEQLDADLATAATVRRAHLAAVIARGDVRVGTSAMVTLVTAEVARLEDGQRWADPARRYAAAVLVPGRDDPATVDVAQLVAAVKKLDLTRLAIAHQVLQGFRSDESLESASGWPASGDGSWEARRAAGWREQLDTLLAYEWSDIELTMLEPPAADDTADGS